MEIEFRANAPTRYQYEGNTVLLELDVNGNQTAKNIHGLKLLKRNVTGKELSYCYNAHGDVSALFDKNGILSGRYAYDAFGNLTEELDGQGNPYKYGGYEHDSETGLYNLRARYYNPKTARFISEDSYRGQLGSPLSLNLYTYCHNEPVRYVDPSGHAPQAEMDIGGPTLFASDLRNLANVETDANEKKRLLKLASTRELEDKKTYNVVGSGSSRYYTPKDSGKSTNDVKQTENKEEVAKQQQEKTLDALQGTLDVVGFVPVIGSGADALNGIISFARGNYEAGFASLISIIPILGDAVGGTAKVMMKLGIYDIVKEAMSLIMLHSAEIIKASKSTGQLIKTVGSAFAKMSEVIMSTLKKIEAVAKKALPNSKKSGVLFEGGLKTIPIKQYDTIMDAATHNTSAKTVMLGKYDGGGATSYITKAGDDYTYFNLGKNWDGIKTQYGYTDQDMFKLFNESFLDDGINAGKNFKFSHNPIGDTGALGMEYNYLKQNGYIYDPSKMMMTPKK